MALIILPLMLFTTIFWSPSQIWWVLENSFLLLMGSQVQFLFLELQDSDGTISAQIFLHSCFPWLDQKRQLVTAPDEPCQISTVLSFASPPGFSRQILTDAWLGYLSDIYQNFQLFFPSPRGWEDKRVNKNLLPSTVIHQNFLTVVQKTRTGGKEQDIWLVKNSKI